MSRGSPCPGRLSRARQHLRLQVTLKTRRSERQVERRPARSFALSGAGEAGWSPQRNARSRSSAASQSRLCYHQLQGARLRTLTIRESEGLAHGSCMGSRVEPKPVEVDSDQRLDGLLRDAGAKGCFLVGHASGQEHEDDAFLLRWYPIHVSLRTATGPLTCLLLPA
jgi:hypothetical protein